MPRKNSRKDPDLVALDEAVPDPHKWMRQHGTKPPKQKRKLKVWARKPLSITEKQKRAATVQSVAHRLRLGAWRERSCLYLLETPVSGVFMPSDLHALVSILIDAGGALTAADMAKRLTAKGIERRPEHIMRAAPVASQYVAWREYQHRTAARHAARRTRLTGGALADIRSARAPDKAAQCPCCGQNW
jgi:hypothetical protein